MLDLPFRTTSAITTPVADVVRRAKHAVWGTNPVHLNQRDDDAILGFGTDAPVRTLSPSQIITFPAALEMVTAALHRVKGTYPDIPAKTLFLDIETHNAGREYDMPLDDFFRLGQYAWGWDGDIVLTTDLDEVLDAIESADLIVAHNGHSFDFSVLLGDRALEFARDKRLLDTFVHANLVFPAPREYRDRSGHLYANGDTPGGIMKWCGLDNLCFQAKLPGKEGDLKALAKKYQPEGTKVSDYNYGLIPTDDADFRAYAQQDIASLRGITRELLNVRALTDYDWREQLVGGINAQISRNGFRVDIPVAQKRVAELKAVRDEILAMLEREYDFPTEGAMPWRTKTGKEAIFKVLSDHGITEKTRPDWPRTATNNLSLGGAALVQLTAGTEAENLGEALAEIMGQRPLAQQALDYCKSDGMVHPSITALQRSGRFSLTRPGLTTWTSRGGGAIEKAYFIPDTPDQVLVEFDYSNADARAVAALSGDREFAKRFEPGADGHDISGEIFFGHKKYYAELGPDGRSVLRQTAKVGAHSLSYRVGGKRLASSLKIDVDLAYEMIDKYHQAYPDVLRWQNRVTDEGDSGFVTNSWGRRMVVDPERSFTQSSALYGQSTTRETLVDGLIALGDMIKWVKATVHDAVVFSIPRAQVDSAVPKIVECLEATLAPPRGQAIHFPVDHGKPSVNWKQAGH